MRLGAYEESRTESLVFILKAWCLIVEAGANGIPQDEIESILFNDAQNGKQFNRWKLGGSRPSRSHLALTNLIAIEKGWIPRELGELLLTAYTDLRQTRSSQAAESGWSEMAALGAAMKYADSAHNKLLRRHCTTWNDAISFPEDDDPDRQAEYIVQRGQRWAIVEEDVLREEAEFYLEHLLYQFYKSGVPEPSKFLLKHLRRIDRNFKELLEAFKEMDRVDQMNGLSKE
jgi:hypothetical protein